MGKSLSQALDTYTSEIRYKSGICLEDFVSTVIRTILQMSENTRWGDVVQDVRHHLNHVKENNPFVTSDIVHTEQQRHLAHRSYQRKHTEFVLVTSGMCLVQMEKEIGNYLSKSREGTN